LPVMIARVVVSTPDVLMLNVAVLLPAAIVTEAGKVALGLLELKLTTTPPVGAVCVIVAVPVEGDPPATDVGDTAIDDKLAPLTVSVAVC